MRRTLTNAGFFLALFCFPLLSIAQTSDEYIKMKADSAWDYILWTETRPDAMRIADELAEIGEKEGIFKAKINAVQIKGENFFYSPYLDSALYYYHIAYDLATKEGDTNEMAYSAVSLGVTHTDMGQEDSALFWLNDAQQIREMRKDTANLLFVLSKKGWLLNMADRHDEAMEVYLYSYDLAVASKDTLELASAMLGMGILHKRQENFASAEESLLESIVLSESINDPYSAAAARGNLGLLYKSMGKYEEAYELYAPIIALYEEAQFTEGLMSAHGNRAIISNLMGDPDNALIEARRALKYNELRGRDEKAADYINEISKAKLSLGELDSALYYGEQALALAQDGLMFERKRDIHLTLSDVYSARGEDKLALESFKLQAAMNDSIFELERSKEVLALREEFDSLKREQEIQRLESEKEMERLQRNTLIAILVVVVLLSSVIIVREVGRRRKAKELHEAEIQVANLERGRLEDQLEFKNRELTSSALHLAQKNELLAQINQELKELEKKSNEQSETRALTQKIDFDKRIDNNWDEFTRTFTDINASFFANLQAQYGSLSKGELRLAALLKMNLSSKQIATILSISEDGVKKSRYRLRKKMELESNESLESVILAIT
ncbi:tetratricopeptide repeat protein [Sanyastnella coralliicola]|uniref:tetratricopeptide repeat protein n=1 Tax=Sanyastnella coralliicola TaxID=3069118 RepID=UPI0027B8C87A|nr:tetratricopeptide repeat protein [Longitalea sp. SCSIO 12813]